MGEWTDRWIDGQMDGWTQGQRSNRQMDAARTNGRKDCMDGLMEERMDGWRMDE